MGEGATPIDKSSLSVSEVLHAVSVAITYLREMIQTPALHTTEQRFAAAKELGILAGTHSGLIRAYDFEQRLEHLETAMARLEGHQRWHD